MSLPHTWMLQLLLVSNLLLWEHAVSAPMCLATEGYTELPIEELFDQTIVVAQYTSNLTKQMSEKFDESFAKRLVHKASNSSTCHTASLATPETNEQIQRTHLVNLLKAMISISRAWYHPLEHLVHAVAALKGAGKTMLLKVKEVKEKNQELLREIKKILVRVHPGAEENVYPAWMGLADVRSANEDTRHFALSNLFRCLHSDTYKVATYLEIVKCRVTRNNNC
ncbi:Prl3a1 [Phodopus roborovskii]|uniref:Prl3a1 protein n=1 Tax=Phodopus roborovskii TaxID=109678 RepID=A0AAU9ZND0_PHORO|nr:Prl3a1 [Phodopus roborovskii]